ncbi:MAG: hypothetical protein ABSA40_03765 [Candidatus Dormibacteria bacterium]|jgi:hypothetical protein
MLRATGEDSLRARQSYLRSRRAHESRNHRIIARWLVFGGVVVWSLLAGLSLLAAR